MLQINVLSNESLDLMGTKSFSILMGIKELLLKVGANASFCRGKQSHELNLMIYVFKMSMSMYVVDIKRCCSCLLLLFNKSLLFLPHSLLRISPLPVCYAVR